MILSLLVAFVGIVVSIVFYYLNKVNVDKVSKFLDMIGLYRLSKNKFYVDEIYNLFLYQPFMKFSKIASIVDWDYYDQKFIDSWGWITLKISKLSGNADYNILDQKIIDGTSHLINFTSKKLKKIQSGIIQNYLLGGFMCLVIIFLLIQQFN
jgi:NADH:ubiquinone oxidoreductase subunit 5 (subunit L)/multisubunit Na+/H+ antiporter MnhA subunit